MNARFQPKMDFRESLMPINRGKTQDSTPFLTAHPNVEKMRDLSAEKPIEIDTYHDHRVAMSFGIFGCYNLRGAGRA